jgi:hypothetical protein
VGWFRDTSRMMLVPSNLVGHFGSR